MIEPVQSAIQMAKSLPVWVAAWVRSIPAYWYVVSLAAVVGALSAVMAVLLTGEYLRSSSAVSVETEEVENA